MYSTTESIVKVMRISRGIQKIAYITLLLTKAIKFMTPQKSPQNVFIACPTHDGRITVGTAQALYDLATKKYRTFIATNNVSLINWNCNQLWCKAMNMREEHGMKWFAMLHSDVIPEPYWLDKLIEIAEQYDIDMLSASVAIKDDSGDTSTGVSNPANNHWNGRRISIKEMEPFTVLTSNFFKTPIMASPEDLPKLLVNTGCCIIRMDQPWSDKVIFRTDEVIRKINGKYEAFTDSEDWNFSRMVHDLGGKVGVTPQVKTKHVGGKQFSN